MGSHQLSDWKALSLTRGRSGPIGEQQWVGRSTQDFSLGSTILFVSVLSARRVPRSFAELLIFVQPSRALDYTSNGGREHEGGGKWPVDTESVGGKDGRLLRYSQNYEIVKRFGPGRYRLRRKWVGARIGNNIIYCYT